MIKNDEFTKLYEYSKKMKNRGDTFVEIAAYLKYQKAKPEFIREIIKLLDDYSTNEYINNRKNDSIQDLLERKQNTILYNQKQIQNNEYTISELKKKQKFPLAVCSASIVSIFLISIVSAININTDVSHDVFLIISSYIIGLTIRKFGRGIDAKFSVLAVCLSFTTCIFINIIAEICFRVNVQMEYFYQIGYISQIIDTCFYKSDILIYILSMFAAYNYSRIGENDDI